MRFFRMLAFVGVLGITSGGCAGDDPADPSTQGGNGGSTGMAGTTPAGSGGTSPVGSGGTSPVGSGGMSPAGAGGSSGQAGTVGGANAGMGGMSGSGGQGGAAGSAGTAGSDGGSPLKNPPVMSAGCMSPTTLTSGDKTIMSMGEERQYIIDIPADYDMTTPYRLFYTSHPYGSNAGWVRGQQYYDLKKLATEAGESAIFVAPQAIGDTWQLRDHALFDALLDHVKTNLCIDTTRVFAIGWSFGGMITYSLALNHQNDIRAGFGIAPANFNIQIPTPTGEPIAWMQTTGYSDRESDPMCPWIRELNGVPSTTQGAKFLAIELATNNGCDPPPDPFPVWQEGAHFCYEFTGCMPGYPTKACTFDGGHGYPARNDPGSDKNWIAEEAWAFFAQF